jgi:hypothetical protein
MASLNESEALREIEQIKKLIAARSEPGAATHPRLSPSTAPGEGSDVEMAELPERPSRKGKEKEVSNQGHYLSAPCRWVKGRCF